MKTLMITGASGTIGKPITYKIAENNQFKTVAVTSGRQPVTFPENVIIEKVNLLDYEEQRKLLERVKPDYLVHLAWGLDGPGFLEDSSNIKWLRKSLDLLSEFKGTAFFFAGSSAEYGEGECCKESDECHPLSLYGECKLAFERIATHYCAANGIRFVGMRFFSVYGIGDHRAGRALPSAISAFHNNEPFTCKGPNNTWDYVFTEDIGKIVAKIINSDYFGVVNVSSGKGVTMKEVFTTLAHIMKSEKYLSFENEDQPGKKLVGSNMVLQNIIKYEEFTSLEEGLNKTIRGIF